MTNVTGPQYARLTMRTPGERVGIAGGVGLLISPKVKAANAKA
jgi:hypothetical protein